MVLADLGFDDWFQRMQEVMQKPECGAARITRVDRDRYVVRNEEGEITAEPAGKLLFTTGSKQDLPCVGDWVLVQYRNDGTRAVIHDLLPRKTFLRRKTAGIEVDYQMIASNVDSVFIVQACDHHFNLRLLERYLVMANEGQVEPIVLLSKSDLAGDDVVEAMLTEIRGTYTGVRAAAFSNETGDGLAAVHGLFEKGKTYCLVGSSGVGKTTLLNRLLGRDEFETTPVRESDGRGRHTTSSRQLLVLGNGSLLIDTPGMREVGIIAVAENVDDSFGDIEELSKECRFNDCSHTVEVGCAVLEAVEKKELDEASYDGYIKLMKEAAFHQMSYVEKRRKDKKFGRTIKEVLKHHKKKQ